MSTHETDFRRVLDAAGLAPVEIIMDGALHRCPTADKPNGKNGVYIAHADEPASIWWQNWRTGESGTWTAGDNKRLTPEERARLKARAEADRGGRQEESARRNAEARTKAKRILSATKPAPESHPYLARKGVKPVGDIRVTEDGKLVIPVFDERDEIISLQFIVAGGEKRFLTGGQVQGGLFPVPGDNGPLYIAEGFATAATIHEATGGTVLAAFNAGNLLHVAKLARGRYPKRVIVICADDDHETAAREGKNPGIAKATEAARQVKALLAVPKFTDPTGKSDFNDMAESEGIEAVRSILAAVLTEPSVQEHAEASDHGGAILVREGTLAETVDAAEAILARPDLPIADRVFQRAGRLVRVGVLPVPGSVDGISRPQGAVVILPVEKPFLLTVLSRHGHFKKYDGRAKAWRTIDPPKAVAEAIMSRSGRWPFPVLRGVVACPTLRADGSLMVAPGYDAPSGYYLNHGLTIRVPEKPTREEAHAALDTLADLLAGFSFVEPVDCAVALALILTAVARPSLDTAPLFSITAPVRGSGKSTLMDIAAVIATGRRSAVLSATADRDELEKRLVGCLLSGDGIINLDNVNGVLRSDLLCQATTAEAVKVRPLGSSDQAEVPNSALWAANGNNIMVASDLARRTLLCRLDPGMERPEERVFAFDPVARARTHRAEYVTAALTVLRAYIVAGRPGQGLHPFGSFERWSGLVRSALVWAGAVDPCDSRDAVLEDDPEAAMLKSFFVAWVERFNRTSRTVKEIVRASEEDDSSLADVLHDIAGEGRGINAKRLGWWLRRNAGRVVDGLRLSQTRVSRVAEWRVLPLEG
ncbi:MAG: toprim domain-containing protein [Pseudodesulfovibrio sp.]|uniref:toprim domain-containing protein n=1 Tax=Pseudodesulfovibrio sp. TaxID=2035812 RepID=UPI003D1368BB